MVLLPLSRAVMQTRLGNDTFERVCVLPTGEATIRFPSSWPGEALATFSGKLERLPAGQDEVPGSFTAIQVDTGVAVGQLGVVGRPDSDGAQEIGYGFNREIWGHGLATEAVVALTARLLSWDTVAAVTAQTATSNPASGRVLDKAGFIPTGKGWSPDDGDLITWQFTAPPTPRS